MMLATEGLCDNCSSNLSFRDDIDTLREANTEDGRPCLEAVSNRGDEGGSTRSWRTDQLPGLPQLHKSAQAGCRFCRYFRDILQSTATEITAKRIVSRPLKDIQGNVKFRVRWEWQTRINDQVDSASRARARGLKSLLIFLLIPTTTTTPGWTRFFKAEKHQLLTFSFSVKGLPEQINTTQWLGLASPLSQDYLHGDRVTWMRQMLEGCAGHQHTVLSSNFVPKRLLDLRSSTPRLIDHEDLTCEHGTTPRYAALSYCWGPKLESAKQLTTTRATLSERRNGLDDGQMTAVLRDAVAVARALSIPYLWIDALCILQDDMSDWESQCVDMTRIYGNATVTFVASSSTSYNEGFLQQKSHRLHFPFQSNRRSSISGSFELHYHEDEGDNPTRASDRNGLAWGKRGWTFQESISSRRQIFFGSRYLHFECASTTCTMGFPGQPRENSEPPGSLLDNAYGLARLYLLEQVKDRTSAYLLWSRVLEAYAAYSASSFTAATDLLPALAGLASQFHEVLQDDYAAGFWKGNLLQYLMWQLGPEDSLREEHGTYLVPSWSMLGRGQRFSWLDLKDTEQVAEFRNVEMKIVGSDRFGAIAKAELHIHSWVLDLVSLDGTGLAAAFLTESTRWGLVSHGTDDDGAFIEFELDRKNDKDTQAKLLQAPMGLKLLLLGTCRPPNTRESEGDIVARAVYGILIQPVPGSDKMRRRGIFEPTHIKNQDLDALALFKEAGSVMTVCLV